MPLRGVTTNKLRLVGEEDGCRRVEVRHKLLSGGSEEYGTVCDDFWNDDAATATCRTLGYSNGTACVPARGRERIWADDVMCGGNSLYLSECLFNGWGCHDCQHDEDAGVRCFDTS